MSMIHEFHDINVTNKAHEVSIDINSNLKYELKIFSIYHINDVHIKFGYLLLLKP